MTTVWLLIDLDSDHMEFFSKRPRTPGMPGVPPEAAENWPDHYEVWVGSVNGGDTLLLERNRFVYH